MTLKVQNGPAKVRAVAGDEKLVSLCQAKQKGCENTGWRKRNSRAGTRALPATDTLSTMLAQEVKELNARQKVQRGDGSDPALMKGLKEATAVLKDLAAVAKTLNDQGADAEARACGVVLLPAVEDV